MISKRVVQCVFLSCSHGEHIQCEYIVYTNLRMSGLKTQVIRLGIMTGCKHGHFWLATTRLAISKLHGILVHIRGEWNEQEYSFKNLKDERTNSHNSCSNCKVYIVQVICV